MKFISNYLKLLPVLLLFIGFQSCSDDDDVTMAPQETTVVDIATSSNDFSILVSALTRANLVTTLQGDGPFTVFAPTDTAFQAFLDANSYASVNDVPLDALTNVLLNHVIAAEINSATLISAGSGYANTLAEGADMENLSLFYNINGTTVELNGGASTDVGANVTTPDLMADNGIVHVVNQVLLPPTIVDHAIANPNLSILVEALAYADTQDPSPNLIGTLAGDGPFTAFAPTNDAFVNVLTELGITALTDLDEATVEAVLGIHVIAGANVTSNELTTSTQTTLNGDINIDASALTITDPNDRVINIVPTLIDIQGTNGVVHVVDRVIRP